MLSSQSFRIHIEGAFEACFWLGLPLCSELYQHKPSPAPSLPRSGGRGNDGSEYKRERRKKAPVNKASQEPRAPACLSLSNFLQTLQEREVLNCFYTPLPARVQRKDRSAFKSNWLLFCSVCGPVPYLQFACKRCCRAGAILFLPAFLWDSSLWHGRTSDINYVLSRTTL